MTKSDEEENPRPLTRRHLIAGGSALLAAAAVTAAGGRSCSDSGLAVRDPANEVSAQAKAVEFVMGGVFPVQADYENTPSNHDQTVALTLFTHSTAFSHIESVTLSPEKAIVHYDNRADVVFDVPPAASASRTRYVLRVEGEVSLSDVRKIPINLINDDKATPRNLHVYLAKDKDDGMKAVAPKIAVPPGTPIFRDPWWKRIAASFAEEDLVQAPENRHTLILDVARATKPTEISNHCANFSDVIIDGLNQSRINIAKEHHNSFVRGGGDTRNIVGVGLDFLRLGERGLEINSSLDSLTQIRVGNTTYDDIVGQGTATADQKKLPPSSVSTPSSTPGTKGR